MDEADWSISKYGAGFQMGVSVDLEQDGKSGSCVRVPSSIVLTIRRVEFLDLPVRKRDRYWWSYSWYRSPIAQEPMLEAGNLNVWINRIEVCGHNEVVAAFCRS